MRYAPRPMATASARMGSVMVAASQLGAEGSIARHGGEPAEAESKEDNVGHRGVLLGLDRLSRSADPHKGAMWNLR